VHPATLDVSNLANTLSQKVREEKGWAKEVRGCGCPHIVGMPNSHRHDIHDTAHIVTGWIAFWDQVIKLGVFFSGGENKKNRHARKRICAFSAHKQHASETINRKDTECDEHHKNGFQKLLSKWDIPYRAHNALHAAQKCSKSKNKPAQPPPRRNTMQTF